MKSSGVLSMFFMWTLNLHKRPKVSDAQKYLNWQMQELKQRQESEMQRDKNDSELFSTEDDKIEVAFSGAEEKEINLKGALYGELNACKAAIQTHASKISASQGVFGIEFLDKLIWKRTEPLEPLALLRCLLSNQQQSTSAPEGWPLNDMKNQYKFMVKHVQLWSLAFHETYPRWIHGVYLAAIAAFYAKYVKKKEIERSLLDKDEAVRKKSKITIDRDYDISKEVSLRAEHRAKTDPSRLKPKPNKLEMQDRNRTD
ncbi:monogalactosyldiacylglycerol synthase 2, chloroplastic-like protein [Tanacetum coccineum]|uniref:Monogalactosyldiacylglycerol synthase 2, chloroplastic-like protein n=1 Tax=Tanacetum coccineum TaxID=301880 RepID=A0ABQ5I294_9ASTR